MDFEERGYEPPHVCGHCHTIKMNGICRSCQMPLPPRHIAMARRDGPSFEPESTPAAAEVDALLPVLDLWLDPGHDYRLLDRNKVLWARHARKSLRNGALPEHPGSSMRPHLARRLIKQAIRRGVPERVFKSMRRKEASGASAVE